MAPASSSSSSLLPAFSLFGPPAPPPPTPAQLAAQEARAVVAAHGWLLLTRGRLGAFAALARAMASLPSGGLAGLMRSCGGGGAGGAAVASTGSGSGSGGPVRHPSGPDPLPPLRSEAARRAHPLAALARPRKPPPPPAEGGDEAAAAAAAAAAAEREGARLLAGLRVAAAELPVWESASTEAAAQTALAAASELPDERALRCCVAIGVLLADPGVARAFGVARPATWAAFCRRARADAGLAFLSDVVSLLDAQVQEEQQLQQRVQSGGGVAGAAAEAEAVAGAVPPATTQV
jgi:hypothetical protein